MAVPVQSLFSVRGIFFGSTTNVPAMIPLQVEDIAWSGYIEREWIIFFSEGLWKTQRKILTAVEKKNLLKGHSKMPQAILQKQLSYLLNGRDGIEHSLKKEVGMSDFKIGDVVKLKNGGPTMEIESVQCGTIECLWFDSNHEVRDGSFPLDSVTKLSSKIPDYEDSLEKYFRF